MCVCMHESAAPSEGGRPRHNVLLALHVGGKPAARYGSKLQASGWNNEDQSTHYNTQTHTEVCYHSCEDTNCTQNAFPHTQLAKHTPLLNNNNKLHLNKSHGCVYLSQTKTTKMEKVTIARRYKRRQ